MDKNDVLDVLEWLSPLLFLTFLVWWGLSGWGESLPIPLIAIGLLACIGYALVVSRRLTDAS